MRYLPILAVVVMFAAGCETAISPIVGTTQPFTLYGYVGAEIDTQAVHVAPIRDQLPLFDPDIPIDAIVKSTDLDTGEERIWQDSLVFFSDDSWAHVFWSEFNAVPLHTYRIDVSRSDGEVSSATTTVPQVPVAMVEAPVVIGSRLVNQRVRWSPVIRLVDVVVEYDVSPSVPGQPDQVISVAYEATASGDDWVVDVELTDDFNFVSLFYQETGVILNEIRMRVFSVDDAWVPPGGTFDFELLAEPGTLDNVENGFGFIGAGVRESVTWLPDDATLRTVGYSVP